MLAAMLSCILGRRLLACWQAWHIKEALPFSEEEER